MKQPAKTHYPDSIFGHPCCYLATVGSDALLSTEPHRITCRACKRIVEECERAEAQRRQVAHG